MARWEFEYPGCRPPVSGDLDYGGRLPQHLLPSEEPVLVRPAQTVVRCTTFAREEVQYPAEWPEGHEDNPLTQGYDLQEIPELVPGWTVQSARH